MLFKVRRRRALMRASDRARDRGDWIESAGYLQRALKIDPNSARIWVQYGHSLKEGGRSEEAEKAYLRATALRPKDAETFLHLGHVRKRLARMPDAIEAFATALNLDPECHAARSELLGLGARDALPKGARPNARRAKQMTALTAGFDTIRHAMERWTADAPAPATDYASFRALYPIVPPPLASRSSMKLIILAEGALPAMVRTTLLSLLDQSLSNWTARVAGTGLGDHSVASFSRIDERISFSSEVEDGGGLLLWLDAGTVLDPHALAWMLHAADRSNAAAIFADDDSTILDWRAGRTRFAPRFFPMFDPIFFETSEEIPIAVMTRTQSWADIASKMPVSSREIRRRLLLTAGAAGPVTHIPRTLFSDAIIPPTITADGTLPSSSAADIVETVLVRGTERITVVIATRDLPDMLESCVESLRKTAAAPELMDILILDNRSVEPATHRLLERWSREGVAKIIPFDEPFNWSRANNIGAKIAQGDILCLVNNDTVCLTPGWDTHQVSLLRRPEIGIVGARLLYPDHTLQHAGVVMGIGRGSPMHEGVGVSEEESGPLGRWLSRRSVPAVTGAFLAIRRDLFAEIGGLDEIGLPIGFNDIDLCLKVRSLCRRVVYEPAITLVHHESKTRGYNDTLAKLVWDHGELETFYERWGEAIFDDPGYNPHWSKHGEPFDGFVEPSLRSILAHIDHGARIAPWSIGPDDIRPTDQALTAEAGDGGLAP